MTTAVEPVAPVFQRVAGVVDDHFARDRQLRRNLPGDGHLHLDRALPFLVVHRYPPGRLDEGTAQIARAFSSHLVASGEERFGEGLSQVVTAVAEAALGHLGGFLLVEVWVPPEEEEGEGRGAAAEPGVTVVAGPAVPDDTVERLVSCLRRLRLEAENGGGLGVPERFEAVDVRREGAPEPPGLEPLLTGGARAEGLGRLGLELSPFYRDAGTGAAFPRVVHALARALTEAFAEAFFTFAEARTRLDPPHPRALGRRNAGRAATHVDRRLGEVHGAFDTLLQVTPVNTEAAWRAFRESGFDERPELRYRPQAFDPEHLKRRLFHVPIERVEDPLLGFLFREKQEELDREITMMRDLETPRFFHASAELYGTPDDGLVALAERILETLPPPETVGEEEEYVEEEEADRDRRRYVGAEAFARMASEEIDRYRQLSRAFTATVEIRPDVAAGLMVSKGVLCVSDGLHLPRERVRALLSHEIGTHLVTWVNGGAQPLRLFASGLAGYDSLQEGLAVLSEYLVGGLTVARARVLAGRVVAVRSLVDGAGFVDTFRLLHDGHGFQARTAFVVTLRVHRGGGLTKDHAYLRGLRDLMRHLREKGELDVLFVGKLGLAHATVVQELVLRGVLQVPVLKPFYTSDLAAMERLGACRRMDVMDLVEAIER